jgi:hypothetical protein
MADRGNYSIDNKQVLWDAQGKPYYPTTDGRKSYIPPIAAAQYQDDPRMLAWAKSQGASIDYSPVATGGSPIVSNNSVPDGDFFHHRGEWNSEEGQYDTNFDWGAVLTLAVAGVITAGVATAALGGGTAAQTAVETAIATGSPEAGASAAGVTASTALGSGVGIGETGASVGLATGAGLPGLTAAPLAGAGATAAGTGVGLGETGATVGLESGAGLPGAVAAPTVGDLATVGSSIPGMTEGGLGTTGLIDKIAQGAGTISKIGDILGAAGAGVSGATQAAGDTQYRNALIGLTANGQNITGNTSFENALMKRAGEEDTQRSQALKDVYRQGIATHPNVSPFNPTGGPQYSQEYLNTLGNLKNQGVDKLSTGPQYDTRKLPAVKPYTDYNPNTIDGPGGTQPSTMQTIGNWLGPSLSTIGAIAKLLK